MSDPITSLHYAPNGNFVNGQYAPGSDGFNLADVSSVDQLNSLPAGVKGLVWLGMGDGATASFQSTVSQYIGNPNLYGFYLVDEPNPSQVSAASLMAESDWIHANVPGAKTFIVLQNMGTDANPVFNYNTANTHVDLFGLDPYPVQTQFGGANYGVIPTAVTAAEAAGISQDQIVPVYQAFGLSGWILPSASEEQQILSTWGSVVPKPAFDYAYSWGVQSGDVALSESAALQSVFAAHNALGSTAAAGPASSPSAATDDHGTPATPPPPASTTATPDGSGTDTTAFSDSSPATPPTSTSTNPEPASGVSSATGNEANAGTAQDHGADTSVAASDSQSSSSPPANTSAPSATGSENDTASNTVPASVSSDSNDTASDDASETGTASSSHGLLQSGALGAEIKSLMDGLNGGEEVRSHEGCSASVSGLMSAAETMNQHHTGTSGDHDSDGTTVTNALSAALPWETMHDAEGAASAGTTAPAQADATTDGGHFGHAHAAHYEHMWT